MLADNSASSSSVGFTYGLQQRRREVLADHSRSSSVGYTYFLQQRRREVLADNSASSSSVGSLTYYSSEGGKC